MLLIVAGHETTVNLLGNATLALLRHPDQFALLRERPELLPGAVEEFLRYDTSVERSTNRYAAQDVELGGVAIPRGSVVTVALGSASHGASEARGEDPLVLDVTRPHARHLAFGHGIHYCLGAPLARLEATIALGALLSRVPELEPAVPADHLRGACMPRLELPRRRRLHPRPGRAGRGTHGALRPPADRPPRHRSTRGLELLPCRVLAFSQARTWGCVRPGEDRVADVLDHVAVDDQREPLVQGRPGRGEGGQVQCPGQAPGRVGQQP